MFSRRTVWSLAPNPLTLAAAARRAAGLPIADLTESNPTRVGLQAPWDKVAAALDDPSNARYEPEPFGLLEARAAIAQSVHGGRVPAEHIVLTASTSEAYGFLFKLLCDPGDRVLVPAPSYPLFDFLAELESVEPVAWPSRPACGEWHADLGALEARVDGRTRAVLLVSPNNPTGAVVRHEELLAISRICRDHGLALICDEVFADTLTPAARSAGDRVATLAGHDGCLTFVLNGLSKGCLLPQLKLAWIATSGPESLVAAALARLEVIADTWLSVATPVQRAVPRLLELRPAVQAALAARLEANRAALGVACHGTAVSLLPADGGWSAVLRVPRLRSDEAIALDLLQTEGILVHPGYFFDFASEGYLVVSLLPQEPVMANAATRLCHAVGLP